jgi:hypothetical protein
MEKWRLLLPKLRRNLVATKWQKGVFRQISSKYIRLNETKQLKGTHAWYYLALVFCMYQTCMGQRIMLSSIFDFILEFNNKFIFFSGSTSTVSTRNERSPRECSTYKFRIDLVDVESHSTLTQLTWSLT